MVSKGRSSGSGSSSTAKNTAGRASKSGSEWPNLPADVLQLIAKQYLDIFDAHSLTAVCKDWNLQSSSLLHPPEPEPPWLLTQDLSKLYQSRYVSNKPYVITNCARHWCASPVASKLGWLLMEDAGWNFKDINYFFWYPFARGKWMKILPLPPIETSGYRYHFRLATFSCSPESPECVIFGVNYKPGSEDLLIRTCRRDDRKWKKHVFACRFRRDKYTSLRGIVYMEQHQMLYCLFEDGSLGGFCPTDNSWNLLINADAERMFHNVAARYGDDCLVESGGVLLRICGFYNINVGTTRIFKFDPCQVAWVEQDTLGDRVLFLGVRRSSISMAATGRMAALAGRIYVQESDGLICREGDRIRKGCSDDLFSSEVSEGCHIWGTWVMPPYAK